MRAHDSGELTTLVYEIGSGIAICRQGRPAYVFWSTIDMQPGAIFFQILSR